MRARPSSTFSVPAEGDSTRPPFTLENTKDRYTKQYANLYWLRLVVLRKRVESKARARWSTAGGQFTEDGKQPPQLVGRVLDVESGKLCFIIGTVYAEMSLKPNVLEDLAREHYVAPPPPRRKFCSAFDEVMLEDESGRVRLTGAFIDNANGSFVTGTIMAALGFETATGDFEVISTCFAGLPQQPPRAKSTATGGEWIAILSALEMGATGPDADLKAALLAEWLTGELGADDDAGEAVQVTRLILAGNSLAQAATADDLDEKTTKPTRYGYDRSLFSAEPTSALDTFLELLLPSMAVDLVPGEFDPTPPTMPQQALHPALLPKAGAFEGFGLRTNPFWCDAGGAGLLGTAGQPLDDVFKYLESEDRLGMAHNTLEWSHIAPTCPDTLWCFPFSNVDPFILHQTPHVYFIGSQPKFETSVVKGEDGQECRIVLVPKFSETGEVVLVNSQTGETRVVTFELEL